MTRSPLSISSLVRKPGATRVWTWPKSRIADQALAAPTSRPICLRRVAMRMLLGWAEHPGIVRHRSGGFRTEHGFTGAESRPAPISFLRLRVMRNAGLDAGPHSRDALSHI